MITRTYKASSARILFNGDEIGFIDDAVITYKVPWYRAVWEWVVERYRALRYGYGNVQLTVNIDYSRSIANQEIDIRPVGYRLVQPGSATGKSEETNLNPEADHAPERDAERPPADDGNGS